MLGGVDYLDDTADALEGDKGGAGRRKVDARRKGIFARNFNVVYDVSGEMGGGVRARERAHLVFVCGSRSLDQTSFYQLLRGLQPLT